MQAPLGFLADHDATVVAAGGRFNDGETWAYSVNVESLRRAVLAQLDFESYYRRRPRDFRYVAARGGYLFLRRRKAAGGITAGYRRAYGARLQSGAELGLPLLFGDSTSVVRIEPTYVISRRGVLYNYRFRFDHAIRGTPWVAGLSATARTVPMGTAHPLADQEPRDYFASAITLLVGAQF